MSISEESPPYDPEVKESPKPSKSNSSSELSLLLALKQLQRFRPHLGAGCLSLLSSMKFCTIFAKQTELGSNSVPPSLLLLLMAEEVVYCDGSPTLGFSAEEILNTLGNCLSKSLLNRDFKTGLAESVRNGSLSVSGSVSSGWIFIGKGMAKNKEEPVDKRKVLFLFFLFKKKKKRDQNL